MVIILFLLVFFAFAYFTSIFLKAKGFAKPLSRNATSVTVTALIVGSISLFLVIFDSYKITYVILILFFLSVAACVSLFSLKVSPFLNPMSGFGKSKDLPASIALFFLVFVSAYLYFFFPTEYIKGDRDHGVYVVYGSQIQKTGGLDFDDPNYEDLHKILGDNIVHGYQSIEPNPNSKFHSGSLSPRFYPLYPTFLALAWDLFGIDGAIRVNSVFGILSVIFIFLIARRLIGPWGALVAAAFCALNPAQLWNVRTTLSETLGQLLIIFSAYLALDFFRKNKSWMFFAGVVLGLSSFNRIDSLIYFPAIVLFIAYLLFMRKKYLTKGLYFLFGFTILSALGILYGLTNSKPYILYLWNAKPLLKLTLLCAGSLLFLIALLGLSYFEMGRAFVEKVRSIILKNLLILRILIFATLFSLVCFANFVQPKISARFALDDISFFYKNGFLFFQFYVPFALIVIGIIGLDFLSFRKKYSGAWIFLLLGSFLSFTYLYEPSVMADHFWASRRWVLFSVPFVCIMGVVGIYSFPVKTSFVKWILIFSTILGYSYHLYKRDKLILFERMYSEYSEEFERLTSSLPEEKAIYFTKKEDIASPLRYISGKNTYLIHKVRPFLQRVNPLMEAGWNVYLIDQDFHLKDENVSLEKVERIRLNGNFPMDTINRYPDLILSRKLQYQVYKIDPKKENDRVSQNTFSVGPEDFVYDAEPVISDKKNPNNRFDKIVAYDFYLAGRSKEKYRAEFIGNSLDKAKFSVTANQSSFLILSESRGTGDGRKVSLEFMLEDKPADDIQIRIHSTKAHPATLESLNLRRVP
ncbi:hypothetical protein EHQ27_03190 [Leptospira wolffii]|uniref:glycosyltransferase family 39 protein n=1 Tax=Leptospira wolffii TaxID=409998 RepID=UPI0010840097|nr:glycosyltransferase family 39 protein [Leptospira wolffii]TGK61531.1 hypothetical protein EHQ32_01325 [Leptospira wolffii]TGK70075.1 hypothetical protein EHQ35_16740 [Leptospira wolffii]TGK76998.1 hypothetical protein EHQ27_03190 [Leptospira wolffii]TGL31150.1 hypothetical protein EHQ57_07070 [Leptospira wolffii]